MNTRVTVLLLLAGVLAVSTPALAHHGNAAYDGTITTIKAATVTKLTWANPHTLVQFDVKDDKGELVHWVAELGSPSALGNVGWNKNSLQPGDVISTGTPAGVGLGRSPPVWLREGDVVSLGISGLGSQRQRVVRFGVRADE